MQAGLSPNERNSQGITPLQKAITLSNLQVVELLISYSDTKDQRDVKEGGTLLHLASREAPFLLPFLSHHIDVNATDNNGQTALHVLICASENIYKQIIELLTDLGADIDARDFEYATPLHTAITNKNFTKIRALAKMGADIKATNYLGKNVFIKF